jgi:LemA protein
MGELITVVIAGMLLMLFAAIWIYNRLIADRNQVLSAWSDIDVQLMRRHQLVPQLVETVKAYAAFEKATLTAVTELRARSDASRSLPDKAAVEADLHHSVQTLLALAEAYPDLQADDNFRQLQTELTAIEDHIQYARRFYNGAVRLLNTRIQSFPHLLLARPLGFRSAEFFEVSRAHERAAPTLDIH